MTKGQLVALIAEKAGIRRKDAEAFLKGFEEVVADALKKGEKVEIRNFGTFLVKERAPRTGRNPRTGKKVKIPAKLVPVFKPGKGLKEAVERIKK
jgi:DNA-binding protein HU-beta